MSKAGLIVLLLFLLIPLAFVAYILITRFQAHKAGLPAPPIFARNPFSDRSQTRPSSEGGGGILDWVRSKVPFTAGQKTRSSGAAYEQPLGGHGRRGWDPDEAWDTRVGNEADGYGAGGYYEEQELGSVLGGSRAGGGAYAGGGYGGEGGRGSTLPDYGAEEGRRGRSRSREPIEYIGGGQRELDARYDENMGSQKSNSINPFEDNAERSDLRGASPKPVVESDSRLGVNHKKQDSGDSPNERRSLFRENI